MEIVKALRAGPAYDPYVPDEEFTKRGIKRIVRLEELLSKATSSIHGALNQETEGMFSRSFTQNEKGAYLINTSRGKVINQKALGKTRGRISEELAIDVYEVESLWTRSSSLPNLICTSHRGSTEEAFSNATGTCCSTTKEIFHIKETAPLGS